MAIQYLLYIATGCLTRYLQENYEDIVY